ncbi:entericidin A/B family lipoprotein [Chelativorans xinjiangense]|nr:entericidin A/B family lipoprotein [Chelativorans xinjiangense]
MKLLHLVLAALLAISVSACANTIRGVGKDIKETGHAIRDATD